MRRTIRRGLLITWGLSSAVWVVGWLAFFSISAGRAAYAISEFRVMVLAFVFGVPVAALCVLWVAIRLSRRRRRKSKSRHGARHRG